MTENEKLTEKRDGQNTIPLRQDGKTKWVLASAGMGKASTQFLYGTHADRLAEYEAIGTIEECRTALERMKPKKAKWHPNPCVEDNRIPICPNCNTIMVRTEIFGRTIDEHCVSCGQAIDWSE